MLLPFRPEGGLGTRCATRRVQTVSRPVSSPAGRLALAPPRLRARCVQPPGLVPGGVAEAELGALLFLEGEGERLDHAIAVPDGHRVPLARREVLDQDPLLTRHLDPIPI